MKNWKKVLSLFLAFILVITGFQVGAGTVTASTATEISITGAGDYTSHSASEVRFTLTTSGTFAADAIASGFGNLVEISGMGDAFQPSDSYGVALNNSSTMWLILAGVSYEAVPTVPEGATITIKAGTFTVNGSTYSIPSEQTLTYKSGAWVEDKEEENEGVELTITGVDDYANHDVSEVRFTLTTSGTFAANATALGFGNLVEISGMGDAFRPSDSYGYALSGTSTMYLVFEGVSHSAVPSVPEGATITIKAGTFTVSDSTYSITSDVTWIYENGSWREKKDLPELFFTGVSALEDHWGWAVRLRLDTSEPIKEGEEGSDTPNLSNVVALSGMGDSFNPTSSYGFITYGESQMLLIFEGITITNMPTVPDGAQITFTPGEITIGDTLYYMTSDFSMTYDASASKWLVTEGYVTVSGIAEGTSDTATAEAGYKQISFDGVSVETGKNTNEGGGWLLYLTTAEGLPGEDDDSTKFTGIQMSVNDGEKFSPEIIHSSTWEEGMAFIWLQEHRVPQEIDKEYKITIHAGKGEPGSLEYEGIQLMEDYVLTLDTNETWQLEEVDTSVWDVKLDCDDISNYASDTFSWPCVFDRQETDIQITYDGDTIAFSFPILEEAIASNQYVVMTLKAGSMTGADGSTLELREDVKLYFNEYGVSANEPIILDTTDVSFALSSTSSATALSLEALKEDAFEAGSTLTPARGVVDGVYYRGDNGIFMQGEAVSNESAVLGKADTYSIQLTDISMSVGTELLLQGLYIAGDKLVEYTPTIFTWNGSAWSIQLQPTYVRGDANGDDVADIRDVVRANRYLNENTDSKQVSIYANGANMIADSDVVDGTDLTEMKLTLLGEEQIEMAAYSGPGYRHSGTTAENWLSESDFQDYIDCGFTYLFPETDAAYNRIYNYETDVLNAVRSSFAKSDLYQFMTLAEKMHIPVVPFDYNISEDIQNQITVLDTADKKYFSQMVKDLSQFDMFKGLTLHDEPAIGGQTAVKLIKDYLDELKPNMFTFTSHHPMYSDKFYLTTDTTKSKADAYAEYIDAFSTAYGTFAYDSYPLLYEYDYGNYAWGNQIESTWFQNLELVAASAKDKEYDAGITIQSTEYENASKHNRPITSKADVGFQMYTVLAYGMKFVNYYTYWGEEGSSHNSAMVTYKKDGTIEKTQAYGHVRAVNWEIRKFDHVLLDFDWQGTMAVTPENHTDSDAFSYVSDTYEDGRITSATATREAIIGCMEDKNGRNGYMIVNATDPGSNKSNTVTVKFKDATKATAYIEGVETELTLTDGSYTFTLSSGQGVFVVLDK